jgi:ABC-type cobalamin/Fe3+-siderophores transport system ATPase subunit
MKEVIRMDRLDIRTDHLKRADWVSNFSALVSRHRIVRLTSPAASGKSSLLKLYQHSLTDTEFIWLSGFFDKSCYESI